MRIHWWQSIRWQLALGSIIGVILVIALLSVSIFLAILHFYSNDQSKHLSMSAQTLSQSISEEYAQDGDLATAVTASFPTTAAKQLARNGKITSVEGDDYLFFIFDQSDHLAYPPSNVVNANAQTRVILADLRWGLRHPSVELKKNTINNSNLTSMRNAIQQAQQGHTTLGDIRNGTALIPRPLVAVPIHASEDMHTPVVGVLTMLPVTAATNTTPDFLIQVLQVVLVISLIVALLAGVAAIIFSSTITRPLAKMTRATHALAAGNYTTRVQTRARGELGQFANDFNLMAEQLSRDVEELHRQEQWRRELIMSITHDLATPLTSIAGLGEALVDGIDQSHEDYEATGRIIVRETLRLRRLVQDLHMMAKVEAGALHPQRKPVRMAALVDEVLAVMVTEFERVDVEPLNKISYQLPVVEADPDMLTRVFSNLCNNALQHTPRNGTVTIEAQQHGSMLAIAVTDTGQGIPPEALERVFERFFRADTSRQSSKGGSGLGLAIVRAIIEAHGGKVWAENVPGNGARFIFTLPINMQTTLPTSELPTLPMAKTISH